VLANALVSGTQNPPELSLFHLASNAESSTPDDRWERVRGSEAHPWTTSWTVTPICVHWPTWYCGDSKASLRGLQCFWLKGQKGSRRQLFQQPEALFSCSNS